MSIISKGIYRPGRVISIMVATSLLVAVRENRNRLSKGTQITVWTIPGLEPNKAKQLDLFYKQFIG